MSDDFLVPVPKNFTVPTDTGSLPAIDAAPAPVVVADRNPGFTSGIVGILFAIIPFLFVVGIPLSINSVTKSRKAGRSYALGAWSFVFNILSFLCMAFLIIVIFGLVDGLQSVCSTLIPGGTVDLPDGSVYTCPA